MTTVIVASQILTTELKENTVVETATSFIVKTLKSVFFTPPSPHSVDVEDVGSLRKQITLEEISNHDNYQSCWIVLYDRVYDITNFLYEVSNFF